MASKYTRYTDRWDVNINAVWIFGRLTKAFENNAPSTGRACGSPVLLGGKSDDDYAPQGGAGGQCE